MRKKYSRLYLLSQQRALDLLPASAGFLSSPSASANLHIVSKTFYLAYPSVDKSKFKTKPTCFVIIERF